MFEKAMLSKSKGGVIHSMVDRRFWRGMKEVYGSKLYYRKLYHSVRYKFGCTMEEGKVEAIKRHIRAMGFLPIVAADGSIKMEMKTKFAKGRVRFPLFHPTEADENNTFVESVPYALLGRYKCELLMLRVVDINIRLKEYFNKYHTKKTTTHNGVSLGYTCVSGGRHAKKGICSGSFHANQNLLKDPDLQADVIDVCCDVLIATFGDQKWYKDAMAYYDLPENKHKKKFLLPGTPCTGIWWSCDGRGHNMHIDRNAYCSAFVFCPDNYSGGALVLENQKMPGVHCEHLLQLGEVIGGRWSRSDHCINDCEEFRNSIVMYGEYRIVEKEGYKHVENINTHAFHDM